MSDPLEVRLCSQACGVCGSFGQCGLAWIVRTPTGLAPHIGRLYTESSRSTDRCDARAALVVMAFQNSRSSRTLSDAISINAATPKHATAPFHGNGPERRYVFRSK